MKQKYNFSQTIILIKCSLLNQYYKMLHHISQYKTHYFSLMLFLLFHLTGNVSVATKILKQPLCPDIKCKDENGMYGNFLF